MVLGRAILVSTSDKASTEEALGLADSAGYKVAETITQSHLLHSEFGLGSGKAQELKKLVEKHLADVVIVDEHLRSRQIYNLAKLCRVEVVDREKLILDIFDKRASSSEAKLQVKLAQLSYEIPRARETVRLAKMGEQPGFTGLGGYEVDVYFNAIKRRATALKRRLEAIRTRRQLYRDSRERLNLPLISLTGYTGAGKTTLFNLLAGEQKETGRGAFTTLSTSTRSMSIRGSKYLISDTVGFISRLPPYIIEAFRSTLEELTHAIVVLLVEDLSLPPQLLAKRNQECSVILNDLGVKPSRVLRVFNKSDLVSNPSEALKLAGETTTDEVIVSAKLRTGLEELKTKISSMVSNHQTARFAVGSNSVLKLSDELNLAKDLAQVSIHQDMESSRTIETIGPF